MEEEKIMINEDPSKNLGNEAKSLTLLHLPLV